MTLGIVCQTAVRPVHEMKNKFDSMLAAFEDTPVCCDDDGCSLTLTKAVTAGFARAPKKVAQRR